MRILDRYAGRQILPVWVWCILVFLSISCLVDLFGRLDEILQDRIPLAVVWEFYRNFLPLVFVRAAPLALLFSAAFITTRMVRHQEFLAMHASGVSLLRAAAPFLLTGWLVGLSIFWINETLVPPAAAVYERLRYEAFRGKFQHKVLENVSAIDEANRLYHARSFDLERQELADTTILEHDAENRPRKTINAKRAIYTPRGWLLQYGTLSRLRGGGPLTDHPEAFVERVFPFPVTPESFRQPQLQVETLSVRQLQRFIRRLRDAGITNVRRYAVEWHARMALPFMSVLAGLIGFVGATQPLGRGRLRGFGGSLGWGVAYYLAVAAGQGMGKEGLLPAALAVWGPHIGALAVCIWLLRQRG